ncbi:hypothetical protein Tco_0800198 [Tanacetum coccineum]|uniref:Uncharacterized protein n=1 Tax=Tanacetum coccineum TaxID=301880 RepID=A0ABQ4ZTF6_9ASTR
MYDDLLTKAFDVGRFQYLIDHKSNVLHSTKASDNADPKSSHDDGSKPSSDDGMKVDEDPRKDSEINVVGGKTSIELAFDLDMLALEDYSIFDFRRDEKIDGWRFGQSTTQTKKMSKNYEGNLGLSMIGSLMYLTSSRPDIMFAVYACSRYLKGQLKLGLWYPKDSPFDLVAFTDSDYVGASLDRKSTIGGYQFLGCRLISWQCKKQTVVANSTTEAEYVAASSCCKGFSGRVTPLFPTMVVQNQSELGEVSSKSHAPITHPPLLNHPLNLKRLKNLGSLRERTLRASSLEAEQTKTTQQNEIASLKRRVKKLEKKRSSRTHKLKRLYKFGLTARVESSRDEQSLGKHASKQGRMINAIDIDEDITLVNVQDDADNEMFDVITLNGEEVIITLAKALEALKTSKPKVKGIVLQEPGESTTTTTISSQANIAWDDIQAKVDADYQLAQRLQAEEQEQFTTEQKAASFKELLEQRRKHFAAKRAEEKRNKPPTKTQQKKYLKNMEDLVEGSSKRAGDKLEQEVTKKQKVDDVQETAKVDDDQESAKIKELMEIVLDEEEVPIDAIHLATKPPTIVDWKIHKEGKKNYY